MSCTEVMPQMSAQVDYRTPNFNKIPKEVLLSCKVVQTRKEEIERKTMRLIADSVAGDPTKFEEIVAQINLKKKSELELIAQVIVSKALDEPQHCQACVSLSGALQVLLPTFPAANPQCNAESFMHALLDIFQTEFENLFKDSPNRSLSEDEQIVSSLCGPPALLLNEQRVEAIVQFTGHLYCHGLLGNMVVSQMVRDLVDNGAEQSANELLWFIGAVTSNANPNLGTVREDTYDSDGASSESIGPAAECSSHTS